MAFSQTQRSFLDGLLQLTTFQKHFQFLGFLITNKAEKVLDIVEGKTRPLVEPISYMAYGLAIYTITLFVAPVEDTLGVGANFLFELFAWFIMIVYMYMGLGITYWQFKRKSTISRSFDQFLILTALTSGTTFTLAGGAFLFQTFFPEGPTQLIFSLVAFYPFLFLVKVYQQFWAMTRGKVVKNLMVASLWYFLAIMGIALFFVMLGIV